MNNRSAIISIIIPVYNVESFLSQTIESVINQTFKDWELILVDDGSTDYSSVICDEYSDTDNRIYVIHKKNGGISSARNVGIEHAVGDYIVFWDSDDICSEDYLESMYNYACDTNADVVYSDTIFISENENVTHSEKSKQPLTIYTKEYLVQLPFEFYNTVWGKIYKKSIILNNNIRFDNHINRGEDTLFIYMIALCIDTVVHSRDKFVNYRIRSGSLMRSAITNVPSLFIQSLAKYKNLLCFVEKHNVEEIALSFKLKWHAAYLVICDFNRSVSNFSEFRLNLELLLQEKSLCYCVQQNKREYPLRARINIMLIRLMHYKILWPLLYCCIKQIRL